MAELLGTDIERPVVFLAVTVAVWVGVFAIIALIADGDPTDAVIPGSFGRLF